MIVTTRQLTVLAAVAVASVAVTALLYGVERTPQSEFQRGSLLIQGLDVGKIAKVTLVKKDKTTTLIRAGDGFTVAERSKYPASVKKVNELLIKVLSIRCGEKVTGDKANHPDLGVSKDSDDAVTVQLDDPDGKPIVAVVAGKSVPRGSGSYVRLLDQDTVYASEESLSLTPDPTNYMDTDIVSMQKDDVEEVKVQLKDGAYTLSRDKESKIVLNEVPKGKRAKSSEPDSLFGALSSLSFENVTPAASAGVAWDTTYTAKLKKHLTYTIQSAKRDDKYYVQVACEGPSEDLIESSRLISKTEPKEKLEKKDAVFTAAKKASDFNARHGAWAYQVSEWKGKELRKPIADLIEDIPKDTATEEIAASHILVSYKGAERSDATRTKDEATKRAEEALAKVKAMGADFAALAKEYSDDPGSKAKGGDLGTFKKGTMHKNFEEGAWKLKVGDTSDIVESPFGFHIIRRTK
jgi:hypothetical protein